MLLFKIYLYDFFNLKQHFYNDYKDNRYSFNYQFFIIKVKISFIFFILFIFIKIFLQKLFKKVKNYSKGRKYIDKCLNNMYIRNNFIFYDFPIYSIIIPAYNCENSIYYPIISIQNQNITQYEIILINDLSKDNTSKVIQRLAKNDKRIKIINNKKNLGTLYSRCIGTLISKGKYIFPLDNDDMLFEEDIFDYLYKVTKEFNYDIIGFRSVNAKSYSEKIRRMKDSSLYIYPNNLLVLQPELSTWLISIKGKYKLHDVTLWGKIIKENIYKKAINLLGIKRYSSYMSWAEDTSMNYIIFNVAESFKFISKYGILHLISFSTASYTQPINNKLFGDLFLTEIIFDFSKRNIDKKYSASSALNIMNNFRQYRKTINNYNLQYFKNIIIKLLSSDFICKTDKYKLEKSFHNFY